MPMTNQLLLPTAGEAAYSSDDDEKDVVKLLPTISRKSTSLLPSKIKSKQTDHPRYFHSPKFFLHIFTTSCVLFTLLQIQYLHGIISLPSAHLYSISSLKSSISSWQLITQNKNHTTLKQDQSSSSSYNLMIQKLRQSVTFLPLKDMRYADSAHQGHTWFMSNMYDTQEEGKVQHQHFPSPSSNGRILCLKGNHTRDGTRNSYALAYPEALPENATLVKGLTFITYNHYDFTNMWHGLTSLFPLTAWHMRNGSNCNKIPSKWFLYHWGELRTTISPWLDNLMEATYGGKPIRIHGSDGLVGLDQDPFCFEEAVVTRHSEGGMSRLRREQTFDLLRCKAREFCNVSSISTLVSKTKKTVPVIRMTMLMRTGDRSFKNDSAVISIFDGACTQVEGCRLQVAYSNNLTFCQQVKLMSETDILVSPHGAQLTNMFFMDKNSSVLEFFPKGWLKLAGLGQYVYRSLASWSGMQHRGAWRDPDGPNCPYPKDDRKCMSFYKNAQIGHNATYFSQWAKDVIDGMKALKIDELSNGNRTYDRCACN